MFSQFYNSSIRRYVILMMELFGSIQVQRLNNGDKKLISVPLVYGSRENFVRAIDKINMPTSEFDVAKIETILPRMYVNLIGMKYNGEYSTSILNRKVQTGPNNKIEQQFTPVPYTFEFEMGIYTRHEDDMFQIIEQILPYFRPHFSCTITELYNNTVIIKNRDINIVLDAVIPYEDLETGPTGRRRLEWKLLFSFNGWLYPNTKELNGQIKTVYLDFFANTKQLSDGEDFESIDTQISPKDATQQNWNGESKVVMSMNTPIGEPPRPEAIK